MSDKKWVTWFDLLNKSKHQTINQLKTFLIEKGLSDGNQATSEAFKFGFVRLIEGKEKWNKKKYLEMMQADKKLKKLQGQGRKEIHPMVYMRACPCVKAMIYVYLSQPHLAPSST